jgi:hypothetical protein
MARQGKMESSCEIRRVDVGCGSMLEAIDEDSEGKHVEAVAGSVA